MKKSRTFIVGDLHGGYKALVQVLDKVDFDIDVDKLICLGDVVDGWSQSKECLDLLMTIKNLVCLAGNHDEWALEYYNYIGNNHQPWIQQGGYETIKSLGSRDHEYVDFKVEQKYIDFMETFKLYHEEEDCLFIHAGLPIEYCKKDSGKDVSELGSYILCWDREMVKKAYSERKNKNFLWGDKYKDIYVGHTPTIRFYTGNYNKIPEFYKKPLKHGNINLMDTGSTFTGRLSIMNFHTKEIWQSEDVRKLYPDEKGRNKFSWNIEKSWKL